MDPAAHIYAVNPYHPLPPHQGIIMPPYMQQQQPNYYYQPPPSEEVMHNHHVQVPPTSSSSSGALPYGVNYSYPHLYHATPPPTPFCCNHIPHSSYYYSYCAQPSPSPSGVLQPPVQLWGAPQPASYVVAPRYMYDKNSTLNHCCGCPNHVCTPKHESPIIKVEEKEPSLSETTSKKIMQSPRGGAGDQSLSLADYPYPVHVARFEDGRNHLQLGEERKQFPFPFVLVPYSSSPSKQKVEDGEGGAENIQNKDGSLRSSQDHPLLGAANGKGDYGLSRESRLGGGDSEADTKEVLRTKEKSSSSKNYVPVKDVVEPPHGYHQQHHDDDDEKRRRFSAPENTTTEDGSCSRVDAKKQPEEEEEGYPMKKKSFKLPPVCLRLEPLRKKKTIGDKEGSRSATSPAANKDTATSVEGTHSVTSSDNNKHQLVEKKKVKTIEVMDDTRKDGENVTGKTIQLVEEENAQNKSQKNSAAGGGCEIAENSAAKTSSEEEKKTEQPELQKRRIILSETEAATFIQSVYRGFEVRKSETLEKLKQLGKIHDEVTKMKKNVEDLNFSWKSNSDAAVDQVELTKQKMVIGESIMGLLLRLDTIQGLHPNLRDRRKSLAKELVALQEQLDSIASSRSCWDVASLTKKNNEHGDMCCATKKEFTGEKEEEEEEEEEESPITEVTHQDLSEDVAAGEESIPIEAIVQQQEEALESSEMVSAGEERANIIIQPQEEDGTTEAMIKMEQNKSTTRPAAGEVEGATGSVTAVALADLQTTCCRVDAKEEAKSEEEHQEKKKKIDRDEEEEEEENAVSDGAEEGKKKMVDEKAERLDDGVDDGDGSLQKKVQEEVEHTINENEVVSLLLSEEEEEDNEQLLGSGSNNVVGAPQEEEEEKEKLQEMMKKLMEAGKEQLDVIFSLTSRVRDLEQKLAATTNTSSRRRMSGNNNDIKKQKKKKKKKKKKAVVRQLQRRPHSSSLPSTQLN